MAMYIDENECIACGDCESVCPTNAISEGLVAFKINADKCTECEGEHDEPQCVIACEDNASCIHKLAA